MEPALGHSANYLGEPAHRAGQKYINGVTENEPWAVKA